MAASSRISVVGSINMDLVASTPYLPAHGQTVLGTALRTLPGGKGANQAIAAARAGGEVTLIGAVGSDSFADDLAGAIASAGVSTDRLRRVDGPSGVALITVDAAGENTIVVIPGANGRVTTLTDADRSLIAASRMIVMQLEIPVETVILAARAACDAAVPVLLNPSPVQELPAELLAAVTFLVVNEGEAAALGDAALSAVPYVVTTLGARGARLRGPAGDAIEVPAPRVDPVDTTGAGDAFAGTLAVALAEGGHPRSALQRACAAGALATTVIGASASSPNRAAIDRMVADVYGRRRSDR